MTTKINAAGLTGSTTAAVLAVGALILAMIGASLLAPARAHASAFPGRNGEIVFASARTTGPGINNPDGDLEIFTMNPDGTGLNQLTKNASTDANPTFSADGKKIVFQSQRTDSFEIFEMNADGTDQKNLTRNPARDLDPSYSPDGKKIVFESDRNDPSDTLRGSIFVMSSDGTQQTALTSDPAAEDENATFSPDGNKIAFVRIRGDFSQGLFDADVLIMDADGTGETRITDNSFEDKDPSFSPDGSRIAFSSNRFGNGNSNDFDILVMGANGSDPTNFTGSTATDARPAFSPDGRKMVFNSTREGGDEDVFTMDGLNGTGQTNITPNGEPDIGPDWQPISATFTVNSTADLADANANDGVCDVDSATGELCTLRAVIEQANASGPRDTIKFDIPGTGVHTITPSSDLPTITQPTLLDGYTQPGSSPNTLAQGTNAKPKIQLSGTNTTGSGLRLGGPGPSSSVIRGLVINRFVGDGIFVQATASGSRIEGNFIGTDATGTVARGNSTGVVLFEDRHMVGGTTPATRNLISGNVHTGVDLESDTSANKILGNLIGTTAGGSASLGNGFYGVALFGSDSFDNEIGNGTAGGSNTIAFNGRDGIEVGDSNLGSGNEISRNSIFSNGGLGIDLIGGTETDLTDLITPNDIGDADTGPNNLQNKPSLNSAKNSSTKTTIAGKLNTTPGKSFKLQFFKNPSGSNEGKTFVGQKSVTTDASGNASFTFSPATKVAAGQTITATATDPAGNTSEFSAPRTVSLSTGSALSPETTRLAGPSGETTSPAAHFKFTSPDPEASFECSLDGGAYYPCSSPENVNRLSEGGHAFEVRAVDEKDRADRSPARWIWTVERNN